MPDDQSRFRRRLTLYYSLFTLGLLGFVGMMSLLERSSSDALWLGYVFLFVTIAIYACIGLICRTSDLTEYYVAGRRVPGVFNGMAIAADWMSAASFIGLAGIVFASGYEGLAYVMGWTGGYCPVAFLLAPYLRKYGGYTIPDFSPPATATAARAETSPCAASPCWPPRSAPSSTRSRRSGVGLVVTRFIGVEFAVGVFFGWPASGLLFLGGMRAVTDTGGAVHHADRGLPAAVSMIARKHHHQLLPQLGYGPLLAQIDREERRLDQDPAERAVRKFYADKAAALQIRIARLPQSFEEERDALTARLESLRVRNAPLREIRNWSASGWPIRAMPPRRTSSGRRCATTRSRAACPRSPPPSRFRGERGRAGCQAPELRAAGVLPDGGHRQPAAHPDPAVHHAVGQGDAQFRRLGGVLHRLALCLRAGARGAGQGGVPATHGGHALCGTAAVGGAMAQVDPPVFTLRDVSGDGIVQWAEILIQPDMIVLAAPEIAGLPYVISGRSRPARWPPRCPRPMACC